ncbi:esterase/lipase family protein [Streptomyces sp. NPDC060198]|uniref:esterase/lipase family protein n=1 Tax=Streptomyces sp. NPDC060198 TaxID=3347070 RepID=UPI003659860C
MNLLSLLTVLPRLPRLPSPQGLRTSSALIRATALDLAILVGHVLFYPTGLTPERRKATPGIEQDLDALPADVAALPTAQGDDRPPVVLLHGFIDNRSVFVLLRRSLARHGRRHLESLNYSPLTCDIRTAAELLGRHIEEICERTGHQRVDIVGHSLGGLIARYYVQCLGGDHRVRVLVTLGTPHGGTAVAPLASAHPIVRQMRAGSDFIEELRTPAPECRTHFVAFWSELDRVMVPVSTARVDHPDLDAENIRVTGIGHLALPVHPAVAARIRQVLDAPGGATLPDTTSPAGQPCAGTSFTGGTTVA